MSNTPFFLEVDYSQRCKKGKAVSGDVFTSTRMGDDSVVTVLADGLGSGIKANVLATLTAKMAAGFVTNDMNIKTLRGNYHLDAADMLGKKDRIFDIHSDEDRTRW